MAESAAVPAPAATEPPVAPAAAAAAATTADAAPSEEAEGSAFLHISVIMPGGSRVHLPPSSPQDTILSVKQLLAEFFETAPVTAYHLEAEAKSLSEAGRASTYAANELASKATTRAVPLNDFLELAAFDFVDTSPVLRVVPDLYDLVSVKKHVGRVLSLLETPPPVLPAWAHGNEDTTDRSEEAAELAGAGVAPLAVKLPVVATCADMLVPPAKAALRSIAKKCLANVGAWRSKDSDDPCLPVCVKSITFSGWNPPPAARQLAGDLLYLQVVTVDDAVYHITSSVGGFYINSTRGDKFNPEPARVPCFSHNLVELLTQANEHFARNFKALTKFARNVALATGGGASPAEVLAIANGTEEGGEHSQMYGGPVVATSWLVNEKSAATSGHKFDPTRAQASMLNWGNLRTADVTADSGSLRDWNEDYQSCVDLPRDDLNSVVIRARSLLKVQTGFVSAAVKAAVAVVKGEVTSMNPVEPPEKRVYTQDNVFVSIGNLNPPELSSLDDEGRDVAVNVNHELNMVRQLNAMDSQELRTVMTCVVDYMGQRLVAQSLIPGILQSTQVAKVVYGSVDHGATVAASPEVHAKFASIAQKLFIAERTITPRGVKAGSGEAAAEAEAEAEAGAGAGNGEAEEEEDNTKPVSLFGPVEAKAIVGADSRTYLLDAVRLTPVDYNYVDRENPNSPANRRYLLRQELVAHAVRTRLLNEKRMQTQEKLEALVEQAKLNKEAEGTEGEGAGDATAASSEGEKAAAAATSAQEEGESKDKAAADAAEQPADAAAAAAAAANVEADPVTQAAAAAAADTAKEAPSRPGAFVLDPENLIFNVNAFTPFTEGQDPEQLKKDEDAVKALGWFLRQGMVPRFHAALQQGLLSPVDGQQLTRAMHSYGINMRYLGVLAGLVSNSKGANGKVNTFLFNLIETEMVARAAKKLFSRLMQDALVRAAPNVAIASFLSCLLGAPRHFSKAVEAAKSSASASGNGNGRSGKGSKGRKKGRRAAAAAGATTPSLLRKLTTGYVEGVAGFQLTHESVWAALEELVQKKFGWKLALWRNGGYDGEDEASASKNWRLVVTHREPALRRLCQKLGLRLVARETIPWLSTAPLAAADIAGVVPVVKHSIPEHPFPQATQLLLRSRRLLAQGQLDAAFETISTAQQWWYQVAAYEHEELAEVCSTLSSVLMRAGETARAVNAQKKATQLYEQLRGMDDHKTIAAYTALARCLHIDGQLEEAVRYRTRTLQLLGFVGGPTTRALVLEYLQLGVLFQQLNQRQTAAACFEHALVRAEQQRDPLQKARCHHSIACVYADSEEYSVARTQMQLAFNLFKNFAGEDSKKTQECRKWVRRLTEKIVEQSKGVPKQLEAEKPAADAASEAAPAAKPHTRVSSKKRRRR